jgi:hypothetical protein
VLLNLERAVSNISTSIQFNPNDANLQSTALNSGFGVLDFNATGNYFCAASYIQETTAKNQLCTTNFVTSPPMGLSPNAPYYVAVVASAVSNPISNLAGVLLQFKKPLFQTAIAQTTNNLKQMRVVI